MGLKLIFWVGKILAFNLYAVKNPGADAGAHLDGRLLVFVATFGAALGFHFVWLAVQVDALSVNGLHIIYCDGDFRALAIA